MLQLNDQNHVLGCTYLIFLLAIFIRWCIALHTYSGENTPPMFGDYEAQRHWMEITYNIPAAHWYKNTSDNNLTYWGLDYPPLTAYHSYLCGLFASFLDSDSIKLKHSHGYENYLHKLFMRCSVLIADLFIYIPAVYWYFRKYDFLQKNSSSSIFILLVLFYPGLILIDYGHFQYNCISLGLFISAIDSIIIKSFKISTILFCLAVNYKQMELYHSLPFFGFFLGKFISICKENSVFHGLKFIISIALTVICTFSIVWLPFLSSFSDINSVIKRIFPVSRGIFEDKVSSFWCILNIFYKIRGTVDNEIMIKLCFFITLVSILPSLIDLIMHPLVEKLKLSLIICSLSFFLFSYHVHEKSILLAAIPIALNFPTQPYFSFWFLLIADFSMLPLILKDGLFLPYLALLIFYCLCFVMFLYSDNVHFSISNLRKNKLILLFFVSFVGCFLLLFISKFCKPPNKYPFLWSLIVSCYSFVHFFCFLLFYYYHMFTQKLTY